MDEIQTRLAVFERLGLVRRAARVGAIRSADPDTFAFDGRVIPLAWTQSLVLARPRPHPIKHLGHVFRRSESCLLCPLDDGQLHRIRTGLEANPREHALPGIQAEIG